MSSSSGPSSSTPARPARGGHHSRNGLTLSSSTSASTALQGAGSLLSDRSIMMPPSSNSLLTRNGRASLSSLGLGSSTSFSGSAAPSGPSNAAQVSRDLLSSLGISLSDLLSSDPDSLFMIHNVRSLTAIQDALASLVDATSEDLRAFVGQRYRDLLGTADTVIDMGLSAEALVERLDRVRQGVERATMRLEQARSTAQIQSRDASHPTASDERNETHELAAALKLVQEAPEAISRALELLDQRPPAARKVADSTSAVPSQLQASSSVEPSSQEMDPRSLADHALRASLIIVLADKAWHWSCHSHAKHARIKHHFAYISSQHASLHPLRSSLRRRIRSLLGTLVMRHAPGSVARSDVGGQTTKVLYHATVVLLLSLRVLDPGTDALQELLDARSEALRRRTRDSARSASHASAARDGQSTSPAQRARRDLQELIPASSQTILHAFRAFCARGSEHTSEFEQASHRSLGSAPIHDGEAWIAALRTLPSATLFESHLPRSEILCFDAHLHADAPSAQAAHVYDAVAVVSKVQHWHSTHVDDTLANHVESLLAHVRSLQHLALLRKALRNTWKAADRSFEQGPGRTESAEGLTRTAKALLGAERDLVRRACRTRAEGVQEEGMRSIAEAFEKEAFHSLSLVREGTKDAWLDQRPIHALFSPTQHAKASSGSKDPSAQAVDAIDDLKRALGGRPPLVDSLVRGAEQGLARLWGGLGAYGAGEGDEEGEGEIEEERGQLWKAHEEAARRLVGKLGETLMTSLRHIVVEEGGKRGEGPVEGYRVGDQDSEEDQEAKASPKLDQAAVRCVAFVARLSDALSSSEVLDRCVSGPRRPSNPALPISRVASELNVVGQKAFDLWKDQQIRNALDLFVSPTPSEEGGEEKENDSKGVVNPDRLVACLAFLSRQLAEYCPPSSTMQTSRPSSASPSKALLDALLQEAERRGVRGLDPIRALSEGEEGQGGKVLGDVLDGRRLLLEPLLGGLEGASIKGEDATPTTTTVGGPAQGEVSNLVRLVRREGEERRWTALAL